MVCKSFDVVFVAAVLTSRASMGDQSGESMIVVTLTKPLVLKDVEGQIIEVQGFALGFIEPGQPPYVLEVEPGTEMALHGVRADDILASIDGRDTSVMARDEIANALRSASRLDFRHIALGGTVDMDSSDDEVVRAVIAQSTATGTPNGGAAQAGAPAMQPAGGGAEATPAPGADLASNEPPAKKLKLSDEALAAQAPVVAAGTAPEVVNVDEEPLANGTPGSDTADALAAGSSAAAAQVPTSGPVQPLFTGMAVRLIGFSSTAMNGARGKLGKFSQAKGVWQVFLENAKAAKAVKPANLEPLGPGEAPLENLPASMPAMPASAGAEVGMGHAAATPAAASAAPPTTALQLIGDVPPRPAVPEVPAEEVLPFDFDHNGWLELLRDGYVQGLRSDQEYPEPPAFHRAFEFVAEQGPPGTPIPRDRFPKSALNMQFQMLMRKRGNEDAPPVNQARGGKPPGGLGKGGGGGGWNGWRPWSPWAPMSWGFMGKGGCGMGCGKAYSGKGGGKGYGGKGGKDQVFPGLLGALGQVAAVVAAGQAAPPTIDQTPPAPAPTPAPLVTPIDLPKANGGSDY